MLCVSLRPCARQPATTAVVCRRWQCTHKHHPAPMHAAHHATRATRRRQCPTAFRARPHHRSRRPSSPCRPTTTASPNCASAAPLSSLARNPAPCDPPTRTSSNCVYPMEHQLVARPQAACQPTSDALWPDLSEEELLRLDDDRLLALVHLAAAAWIDPCRPAALDALSGATPSSFSSNWLSTCKT